MTENRGGRIVDKRIEIDAPAEEVWRALTEADRLTRWFCTSAEVREPGVGGHITISWGPDFTGTARIDIWEPLRHLRTVEQREQRDVSTTSAELGQDPGAQPAVNAPISVDYYFESKAGRTVLRIVHAGFGDGSKWDQEYDAVYRGWGLFMLTLKRYLELHRDEPCHHIWTQEVFPLSRADAWERLLGPRGLCAEGSLAGRTSGEQFKSRTADGLALEGIIEYSRAPEDLAFSLDNHHGSLFRLSLFEIGPDQGAYGLTLLTYGMDDSAFAHWCARWHDLLKGAFA